jgi:hypothetical protein
MFSDIQAKFVATFWTAPVNSTGRTAIITPAIIRKENDPASDGCSSTTVSFTTDSGETDSITEKELSSINVVSTIFGFS